MRLARRRVAVAIADLLAARAAAAAELGPLVGGGVGVVVLAAGPVDLRDLGVGGGAGVGGRGLGGASSVALISSARCRASSSSAASSRAASLM